MHNVTELAATVTVPVGLPPVDVTPAVKVSVSPYWPGEGDAPIVVAVVARVIVSEAVSDDVSKLLSPP